MATSLLSLVFQEQHVQIGVAAKPGVSGLASLGIGGETLPAGALEFDASIQEDHEAESVVTDFPVEEGADISDHIRPVPERITINGIVSNTPLTLLAVLGSLPGSVDRVDTAYNVLRKLRDERKLVSVITSLRKYESMAITSFGVSRNASNGDNMNATVSLREVFTAQTQQTETSAQGATTAEGQSSIGGAVDTGNQSATTPASPKQAERSQSLLSQTFGFGA